MIEDVPVIDAVVHSYNLDESNFANKWGRPSAELTAAATYAAQSVGYRVPASEYMRDWTIEETASMVFLESNTDLAVHHVLPVGCFKEGMVSVEKTHEAITRWPNRFIVYAGVDPMAGQAAIDEFDRQFELLGNPPGLKLYPNSWREDEVLGWKMDDPEIAFPLFEHARKRGVKVIAIHKAVPLGPYPLEHYRVDDIDRAAMNFPDLQFEIVHGGSAFLEETAWQLGRFPNVFVNLEITCAMAAVKPKMFQYAIASLLSVGGPLAAQQIVWGTGAMAYHPHPPLEAFWNFQFDQDVMDHYGLPQFTREMKAAVLGGNYARIMGIDLDERLALIADDEFSKLKGADVALPYSTTRSAGKNE
ncbi:amidohydrolase family protein [Nocardia sp. CA-135398]|uniref:amidohydrolase family protein n=1 Tax=Nocardia sp. CA-135398 TaxID=3239977 RepID=UPI003D97791F